MKVEKRSRRELLGCAWAKVGLPEAGAEMNSPQYHFPTLLIFPSLAKGFT